MADRIVQLEGARILDQGNFKTLETTLPSGELVHNEPSIQDIKKGNDGEIWKDAKEIGESANLEKEDEDRRRGSVSLKVYLKTLKKN